MQQSQNGFTVSVKDSLEVLSQESHLEFNPESSVITDEMLGQLTPGRQWISPFLSCISLDEGTQSRIKESNAKIKEYGRLMAEGSWDWQAASNQPITLFWDVQGPKLWCGDGHHRIKAARAESVGKISVEIRLGTVVDAKIYSCTANSTHGTYTTRQDKRNQIRILLINLSLLPEADRRRTWSDREIARRVGVDHKTVGKVRKEMAAEAQGSSPGQDNRLNESQRQRRRNVKRLAQVATELAEEDLVQVLRTLSPAKLSKFREAFQRLEELEAS